MSFTYIIICGCSEPYGSDVTLGNDFTRSTILPISSASVCKNSFVYQKKVGRSKCAFAQTSAAHLIDVFLCLPAKAAPHNRLPHENLAATIALFAANFACKKHFLARIAVKLLHTLKECERRIIATPIVVHLREAIDVCTIKFGYADNILEAAASEPISEQIARELFIVFRLLKKKSNIKLGQVSHGKVA